MKRAVIITPFDNYSYQVRIKYVERYFIGRGYNVTVLSSDFDHRNKMIYSAKRPNLELLHVPPYKKNLSLARINSHRAFAKKVFDKLEDLTPDIIYCSAPPNYLFKYTSQYKKKHQFVCLIYELGDLWPETLPLSNKIKILAEPVLYMWASIRNRNIKYANAIIYECNMFKEVVEKKVFGTYGTVLYLSKEDYYKGIFHLSAIPRSPLRFAYVGSINNIIDIELIVDIIKNISVKCDSELIVIGGGESTKKLFKLCSESGVKYENHGIVYDEETKHKILSTCHFGLNLMKKSVAVGATMKSLEYFHEGLILINNISADTEAIINDYNCGFNFNNNYDNAIEQIACLSDDQIERMRLNSRRVYEDLFDSSTINSRFDSIFSTIGV